mmetsp:Transcript_43777/g.103039  ORF Transcript_43777/g.103039 Transcript_43777/m.103039 type:complete len:354 (-) Transcript_43777:36-1097(-)
MSTSRIRNSAIANFPSRIAQYKGDMRFPCRVTRSAQLMRCPLGAHPSASSSRSVSPLTRAMVMRLVPMPRLCPTHVLTLRHRRCHASWYTSSHEALASSSIPARMALPKGFKCSVLTPYLMCRMLSCFSSSKKDSGVSEKLTRISRACMNMKACIFRGRTNKCTTLGASRTRCLKIVSPISSSVFLLFIISQLCLVSSPCRASREVNVRDIRSLIQDHAHSQARPMLLVQSVWLQPWQGLSSSFWRLNCVAIPSAYKCFSVSPRWCSRVATTSKYSFISFGDQSVSITWLSNAHISSPHSSAGSSSSFPTCTSVLSSTLSVEVLRLTLPLSPFLAVKSVPWPLPLTPFCFPPP